MSDIFNEYAKIAIAKELVSEDAKNALEKNPRVSSQNTAIIEELYNVKPTPAKGMKYERNIIEIAHPNAVIIAPSYDKVNGLVENENERQDITINQLMKGNSGQTNNYKLAANELAKNLVRVSNGFKDIGDEKSVNLASACLSQLKKEAIAPLVYIAGAAVVSLLGFAYYNAWSTKPTNDMKAAIINLDNSIKKVSNQETWGAFSDIYDSNFKSLLNQLHSRLESFAGKFNAYRKAKSAIGYYDVRNPNQVNSVANDQSKTNLIKDCNSKLLQFKNELESLRPQLNRLADVIKNDKEALISDRSMISSTLHGISEYFSGAGKIIPDELDNIVLNIGRLNSTFDKLASTYENATSQAETQAQAYVPAQTTTSNIDELNRPDEVLPPLPAAPVAPAPTVQAPVAPVPDESMTFRRRHREEPVQEAAVEAPVVPRVSTPRKSTNRKRRSRLAPPT